MFTSFKTQKGVVRKLFVKYVYFYTGRCIFIHNYTKEKLMRSERKSPKRVIINVTEEMHKEIKMRAVFRGLTIHAWMVRAIEKLIEEEKKYE